jgi:hypothetical protein
MDQLSEADRERVEDARAALASYDALEPQDRSALWMWHYCNEFELSLRHLLELFGPDVGQTVQPQPPAPPAQVAAPVLARTVAEEPALARRMADLPADAVLIVVGVRAADRQAMLGYVQLAAGALADHHRRRRAGGPDPR